jgi:hypothetical protein
MHRVRSTFFLVSALVILAACSSAAPGATPTPPAGQPTGQSTDTVGTPGPTPAAGEPTPGTTLTACELVAPADIEAALSLDTSTVAEGELTQAGTVLDPAANQCRYDDNAWGGLVVLLTPTDGVNTFDAVNSVFGDDAEALNIGDGSLWFEDNDRGYFLKGPVLVLLQFTYIVEGDYSSFRDPTIAIGQAAVDRL